MENLFSVIGKRIEDRKKEKNIFENKYWKLSAIERIDYDNKKERIEKENYWGFFPITFCLIRLIIFIFLTSLLFYFISGMNLVILKLGILIFSTLASLFWLIIIIDLIGMFTNSSRIVREIIRLNKRFKL